MISRKLAVGQTLVAVLFMADSALAWYSAPTGRFLNRDPIGVRGGVNLYSYVKNRPTELFDPQGLQASPPATFPYCCCCCADDIRLEDWGTPQPGQRISSDPDASVPATNGYFGRWFSLNLDYHYRPSPGGECQLSWTEKKTATGNIADIRGTNTEWEETIVRGLPYLATSQWERRPRADRDCSASRTVRLDDAPGLSSFARDEDTGEVVVWYDGTYTLDISLMFYSTCPDHKCKCEFVIMRLSFLFVLHNGQPDRINSKMTTREVMCIGWYGERGRS
jgi:RHS repeat-associated protein